MTKEELIEIAKDYGGMENMPIDVDELLELVSISDGIISRITTSITESLIEDGVSKDIINRALIKATEAITSKE